MRVLFTKKKIRGFDEYGQIDDILCDRAFQYINFLASIVGYNAIEEYMIHQKYDDLTKSLI